MYLQRNGSSVQGVSRDERCRQKRAKLGWYKGKYMSSRGIRDSPQCDIMTREHHAPWSLSSYNLQSIDDHNVIVAPDRLAVRGLARTLVSALDPIELAPEVHDEVKPPNRKQRCTSRNKSVLAGGSDVDHLTFLPPSLLFFLKKRKTLSDAVPPEFDRGSPKILNPCNGDLGISPTARRADQ